jgi:hypothetical protein
MLYISEARELFFVDRKFNVYQSVPVKFPSEIRGESLLDGELVPLRGDKTPALRFVIFDALMVNGRGVMRKPLFERMDAVNSRQGICLDANMMQAAEAIAIQQPPI